MTVNEVIEYLKQFPPDTPVVKSQDGSGVNAPFFSVEMEPTKMFGNNILDASSPDGYNPGMKTTTQTDQPKTLIAAIRYYSDLDTCEEYMANVKWPNGDISCHKCGGTEVGYIKTRRKYQCKAKGCRVQFSSKTGTVFEDSPLGLDKWFVAVWCIANDKNGISSYELHRALGVTQKTAWFMLHRVRLAMQQKSFVKLGGEGKAVEADETFIGGKARNMHPGKRKAKGRGAVGKAIVMGILERHGKVRAKVVPNNRKGTVQSEVRQNVLPGTAVYTDALKSYEGLKNDFAHQVIDHAECYVKGSVHTNGMENFWSLLKRAIKGTYVSVEPFHLFRYVDEQSFRFNKRSGNDASRFDATMHGVVGKRVMYKQLIGDGLFAGQEQEATPA